MLPRTAQLQNGPPLPGPDGAPLERGAIVGALPARAPSARQALEEIMNAAPPQERSGLAPEPYQLLMTEIRQHTEACLARPRVTHTNLINTLVEQELERYQTERGERGWHVLELNDELRCGVGLKEGQDRLFIFGQVDSDDGPSIFVGRWKMARGSKDAPIYFQITANAEILIENRGMMPSETELADMQARGAAPWNLQVPRGSPVAAWIAKLYGTGTTGFVEGNYPLGVFTEAVQRVCSEAGYSNMLLPRGRRDPGKHPWHVGSFLAFNGESFLWSDWALDRAGAPIHLTIKVQPRCTIMKADTESDQKAGAS